MKNGGAFGAGFAGGSAGTSRLIGVTFRQHVTSISGGILIEVDGAALSLVNCTISGTVSDFTGIRLNSISGGPGSLSIIHSTFNMPTGNYVIDANKYAATQSLYIQKQCIWPGSSYSFSVWWVKRAH